MRSISACSSSSLISRAVAFLRSSAVSARFFFKRATAPCGSRSWSLARAASTVAAMSPPVFEGKTALAARAFISLIAASSLCGISLAGTFSYPSCDRISRNRATSTFSRSAIAPAFARPTQNQIVWPGTIKASRNWPAWSSSSGPSSARLTRPASCWPDFKNTGDPLDPFSNQYAVELPRLKQRSPLSLMKSSMTPLIGTSRKPQLRKTA